MTEKRRGRPALIDPVSHFWSRVDKGGGTTDECWYWTGSPMATGYGQLTIQGQHWTAHKYAYTLAHGEIVRMVDGQYQQIDHTCHNDDLTCEGGRTCRHRLCCNPLHLKLKTSRENNEDAAKPRKKGRFKEACPQDHPYDEVNTMWVTRTRKGKKINERQCKACNRDRVYRAKTGTDRPGPSDVSLSRAGCETCSRGHSYTPDNTKYDVTTGKRRCKACEKINWQAHQDRKRKEREAE